MFHCIKAVRFSLASNVAMRLPGSTRVTRVQCCCPAAVGLPSVYYGNCKAIHMRARLLPVSTVESNRNFLLRVL
jgi:hypothetical protein